MNRHVTTLKESSNGNGELLPAFGASVHSGPVGFPFQFVNLVTVTTVRADRPVWPANRFQVGSGLVFVFELLIGKSHYKFLSYGPNIQGGLVFVKYIIAVN